VYAYESGLLRAGDQRQADQLVLVGDPHVGHTVWVAELRLPYSPYLML
jgi:hypothetical protein